MQKKPRLVKPKPKSKPKSRASKPAPLRLTLEDELLVRLDALVPKVGCSAAAREFGIVADRHLVARVALLRGLSIMEAGEVSGRVAPPPALHGASSSPEPEARPMASTSEPPLKAKEVIVVGEDGLVATPEGWNRWGSSERIPATHTEVHEYYTANGWERFGAVRVMRSLLSIGVPTLNCRDCPLTRVWTKTARRSSYRTHHLAPAI